MTFVDEMGRQLPATDVNPVVHEQGMRRYVKLRTVAPEDPRLTDARTANAILETGGPTVLPIGAIADGQFLKRVSGNIVGAAGGGGGEGLDDAAVRKRVSLRV